MTQIASDAPMNVLRFSDVYGVRSFPSSILIVRDHEGVPRLRAFLDSGTIWYVPDDNDWNYNDGKSVLEQMIKNGISIYQSSRK